VVPVAPDPPNRRSRVANPAGAAATTADAISAAARQVAKVMRSAAIVTYSTSGATAVRAARERPEQPILGLMTRLGAARRLALVWGLHSVVCEDAHDIDEMVERACEKALAEGMAEPGSSLVVTAGVPFGTPGATNLLRIAWVT
jgi:pyruvate kinase